MASISKHDLPLIDTAHPRNTLCSPSNQLHCLNSSGSTSAVRQLDSNLTSRSQNLPSRPTSRGPLRIDPQPTHTHHADPSAPSPPAGEDVASPFRQRPTLDRFRTLDYLSGPSPFDGLVTPVDSPGLDDGLVWDREEQTIRALSPSDDNKEMEGVDTATLLPRSAVDSTTKLPGNRPGRRRRATTSAQFSEQYFGTDMLGFDAQKGESPYTFLPSHYGSSSTFPSHPRGGPLPEHTFRRRLRLFWLQSVSALISNAFLIFVVSWALADRAVKSTLKRLMPWKKPPKVPDFSWENPERWKGEKVTGDVKYYAQNCGYDVVEQEVETADGYLLKMFKVIVPHRPDLHQADGKGGYPVLIQHGLFQSAGSFITSEERSLAFWLAEHGGYQVYLGNNRGVFGMGHKRLSRNDPRFWDYNIKEYALYDIPAMVDHIRRDTGFSKIAYIGHSQGNATLFASLAQGMVPSLGDKLSVFLALAPAVYAGPLTTGFPFGALKGMKWKTWRRVFGVLDYIPVMKHSFEGIPGAALLRSWLGLLLFEFLFSWTDRNWLPRRKSKMFQFTPSPVSSAGIFWWTGYRGFSTRGCVLDTQVTKWFDARFPPLSIYHGGKDYLVLTQPLLERLETREVDVKVIRVDEYPDGEHCDTFWHHSSPELFFSKFIEDIESTRLRYPHELPGGANPEPKSDETQPADLIHLGES